MKNYHGRHMLRLMPLAVLLLASCSGTHASRYGESKFGYAGVIVRGRILTPTGETDKGRLALNLESDSEKYRLAFEPGLTTILRIEPDRYRLHPTRDLFGFIEEELTVIIAGRKFRVPFPRDILRQAPLEAKPTRLVPIGILEVKLLPIMKGRSPKVVVRLDSSIQARRELVEDMIKKMMDPKTKLKTRDSTVSWSRALERALIDIQGEEESALSYKPAKL
ncbi:MAG: hypothetical protein ABIJ96_15160 [Elusimicrobiota bacterium]